MGEAGPGFRNRPCGRTGRPVFRGWAASSVVWTALGPRMLCGQARSATSFSSASSDCFRPLSIPEATMPSRSSTLWNTDTEV